MAVLPILEPADRRAMNVLGHDGGKVVIRSAQSLRVGAPGVTVADNDEGSPGRLLGARQAGLGGAKERLDVL